MVTWRKLPQRIRCIADDQAEYFRKRHAAPAEGIPILVTGAPRSGTTMLEELFNHPSVNVYHEPFKLQTLLWSAASPKISGDVPADITAIKGIYEKIRDQRAWKYYRKSDSKYPYITKTALHRIFPFQKRRIIIKDPSLLYWMDAFIAENGQAIPIFLYRHPCGIVASLKKHHWDPLERLKIVFSAAFFEKYLHPNPFSLQELAKITAVERMALQTAIFHRCMSIQAAALPGSITLTYEALTGSPEITLQSLQQKTALHADHFNAQRTDKILAYKKNFYGRHEFKREASAVSVAWENQLSNKEITDILKIYSAFNPPYNPLTYAK